MTDEEKVILLAEDDEGDVFLLRRAFERNGFQPRLLVARDGKEALATLESAPRVDLLLTDLKMPVMNGLELLRDVKARARFEGLRCAVLTSSGERRDREAAERLRVDAYLEKPMSSEQWAPVIERLRALLV